MSEIQAFQAELVGDSIPGSAQVRVLLQMTLIREADRAIAGARRFDSTATVTSDSTAALIAGLESEMQSVLSDVIAWVQALT